MSAPARIGLCFDLDGVLIHTMPLHAQAWRQAVSRFGLRVSRLQIYQWEGEPGRVTASRLFRERDGRRPSRRLVRELLEEKEQRFTRMAQPSTCVDPAWIRCLTALKRSGMRLALVTGTSSREVARILPKRVQQCFHVLVTGDAVRRGKPHPEPYRTACRRLGILPSRAVVIENAPYGIRSARRAGVGCVAALTSSLPARYLHEAHRVFATSLALRKWLRCLAAVDGKGREAV